MSYSLNKVANNLQDTLNTQLPTESYKYKIQQGDTLQSIVQAEMNTDFTLSITQRDKIIAAILRDPRNHLQDSVNLPINHVLYITKRIQL